jgi:hypothetical protein
MLSRRIRTGHVSRVDLDDIAWPRAACDRRPGPGHWGQSPAEGSDVTLYKNWQGTIPSFYVQKMSCSHMIRAHIWIAARRAYGNKVTAYCIVQTSLCTEHSHGYLFIAHLLWLLASFAGITQKQSWVSTNARAQVNLYLVRLWTVWHLGSFGTMIESP